MNCDKSETDGFLYMLSELNLAIRVCTSGGRFSEVSSPPCSVNASGVFWTRVVIRLAFRAKKSF